VAELSQAFTRVRLPTEVARQEVKLTQDRVLALGTVGHYAPLSERIEAGGIFLATRPPVGLIRFCFIGGAGVRIGEYPRVE
jgi:hypothetical protein